MDISNTTWHDRWRENKTAWDLNGPHPLTAPLWRLVANYSPLITTGDWLIPGCGRAHDGVLLLALGARRVIGRDLVAKAIDAARVQYGDVKGLILECANIFDVPAPESGGFSGVFDRAMFCALSGQDRERYVSSVHQYLKVGGVFASIPFSKTSAPESGPPFQVSERDLRDFFGRGWEILHLEPVMSSACDQKILGEWIFIARKL